MFWAILLILAGFLFLVKGADLFVDGASHLAYTLGVTPLFVGLTIVAFGTSAPELSINLLAAQRGKADIAFGNVVGSNIANIALILGVSALVRPVQVRSIVITREIPFLFLTSLALWFLTDDRRFQPVAQDALISRGDGLTLLLFFAIFLYYLTASAKAGRLQEAPFAEEVVETQELHRRHGLLRVIGMILIGLAGVLLGGQWVVNGSVTIARAMGWSDALIGVTLVAVGTSLPELATSVAAARRQASDVAVGNAVGSNIFNTVAVLGFTAVVHPLRVDPRLIVDLHVVLLVSVALFVFTLNARVIHRWEGALLALGYVGYFVFAVLRN